MLGKRSVVDDFGTQPAEVRAAASAFHLIASPVLGDGDAAVGAGFGA